MSGANQSINTGCLLLGGMVCGWQFFIRQQADCISSAERHDDEVTHLLDAHLKEVILQGDQNSFKETSGLVSHSAEGIAHQTRVG